MRWLVAPSTMTSGCPSPHASKAMVVPSWDWTVRVMVGWSGGEAVGTAEQERRVPDRAEAEQDHQHPVEAHAEAAVRRGAEPERVHVVGQRFEVHALLRRLLDEHVVPVFT